MAVGACLLKLGFWYSMLKSLFAFLRTRSLKVTPSTSSPLINVFLKIFIYLLMRNRERERERERERGRDTGRGRSRLQAGSPMRDLIPGLQNHTLG